MEKKITERKEERDPKSSKERSFKRRSSKRSGRPDPIDESKDKETLIHGHNDLSWLTRNTMLAKIASRVPFGRPSGYPFNLFKMARGLDDSRRKKYVVPGIVTFPSFLGAGVATDAKSPINQAALSLWVQLRQGGTGALVDDPNDVALYYLSIAQLLAMTGWMRRVMAELSAVNPLNRYVRQGLVYSEGLNYDDFVSHYSEFAFFVAWFAAQVNNFIFPKIPYFDQAYTAFHYVYKDEASAKAQCYMFTPIAFGRFRPLFDQKGGAMVYDYTDLGSDSDYLVPGNNLSFAGLKSYCTTLLNELINDQATATLSAAVLKVYGEGSLWRLSDIDVLHEQVEIVMDAELLMQIHNIQLNRGTRRIMDAGDNFGYSSEIPAVESGLSPYLVSINAKNYNIGGHDEDLDHSLSMYFDAFTDEPSEGEVLLMARLKSIEDIGNVEGENVITQVSQDAIVPVSIMKVVLQSDSTFTAWDVSQVQKAIGVTVYRQYLTEFQFAPLLYNYGASDQQDELIGEIHNFATVEDRVIEDIHLNNLLSLFDVPLHR